MADEDSGESLRLKQDIGLIGALSIVIGVVLGAGAFMKPAAVMAVAGDSTWALAAWGIGAVLSMAGGLTLCELGVLFPRTGGIFVFLEENFRPRPAGRHSCFCRVGVLPAQFFRSLCCETQIPRHGAYIQGPLLSFISKKYLILTGSLVILALLVVAANVIDTRPVLKVAVDTSNPPIAFEGRDGKISGVDIDIIEALGREMGYQLSIRPTSFGNILLSVEKGLNDVAISEITVAKEREKQVGFSKSYCTGGLAVLVPLDSKVTTLSDLAGMSIGVKSSSTGEQFVSRQAGFMASSLDASTDLAMMFAAGKLDAVLFDKPTIEQWIAGGTVRGKIINVGESEEEYAIAFRRGDKEMREKLNKAIDSITRSGELEKILEKWSMVGRQG